MANLPHPANDAGIRARPLSRFATSAPAPLLDFSDDIAEAAGGEDVFGDIKRESVQATTEMILARKPDVIVELRVLARMWPRTLRVSCRPGTL